MQKISCRLQLGASVIGARWCNNTAFATMSSHHNVRKVNLVADMASIQPDTQLAAAPAEEDNWERAGVLLRSPLPGDQVQRLR